MRLAWIELRDFRNYRELALEVPAALTAVVGANGHGKTNLLEAMYYLCALESPRIRSDLPLVRDGAQSAFLRGEVESPGGRLLVEVEVRTSGQNRVQVNRTPVRRKRDLRRHARAVFCGPDDLHVVGGEPDERRRFMDDVVRSLWPNRDGAAPAYERVLRQRNRLLKDWDGRGEEPSGLSAWDRELVANGANLTRVRREAVDLLAGRASEEYRRLTGEGLSVEYRPSVAGVPEERAFESRLAERRADELTRRTTLVGPHRDELALAIHGLAARGFASHGEAWAAAVALRLAQAAAVSASEGAANPLTCLDDPFSGLDPERRLRLADGLGGRGQVVLAVPEDAHIPVEATVWRVKEGAVVPE